MDAKDLMTKASTGVSVAGAMIAALAPDYGLYGIVILVGGLTAYDCLTTGRIIQGARAQVQSIAAWWIRLTLAGAKYWKVIAQTGGRLFKR